MLGRYFFLGIVALGLAAYMHGQHSTAATGTVAQSCANAGPSAAPAASAPAPADVTATIGWTAPGSAAAEVWFDLGVARDFHEGFWSGHGPLAPDAASFTTGALTTGVRYYYRVNALGGGAWRIVAAGSFVAGCPDPVIARDQGGRSSSRAQNDGPLHGFDATNSSASRASARHLAPEAADTISHAFIGRPLAASKRSPWPAATSSSTRV